MLVTTINYRECLKKVLIKKMLFYALVLHSILYNLKTFYTKMKSLLVQLVLPTNIREMNDIQ